MSLHLLRHAKAGDRQEWDGPDEARPLSQAGAAQADALVGTMAGIPVKRILSSRYRRCVQTVEPLARHLGLEIEIHPALAEEADVAAVWDLVVGLAGTEAVLCTHGNLVGPVLDRLHRRGVDILADRWSCKKGSTWTIEVGPDRDFTGASYLPPPPPA